MPKVDLHPLIKGLHGRFGDLIFRVTKEEEQTITKVPDMSNVQWSQDQKDHRVRWREASLRSSAAMKDPELRPFFEEMTRQENKRRRRRKQKETRACDMAFRYYFFDGEIPPK